MLRASIHHDQAVLSLLILLGICSTSIVILISSSSFSPTKVQQFVHADLAPERRLKDVQSAFIHQEKTLWRLSVLSWQWNFAPHY